MLRQAFPSDVRWAKRGPLNEAPVGAAGEQSGSRDVARRIFEAAAAGDRDTVDQHSPYPSWTDTLLA